MRALVDLLILLGLGVLLLAGCEAPNGDYVDPDADGGTVRVVAPALDVAALPDGGPVPVVDLLPAAPDLLQVPDLTPAPDLRRPHPDLTTCGLPGWPCCTTADGAIWLKCAGEVSCVSGLCP